MASLAYYRGIGACGETSPRTVTESDLIQFARLSGDFSRMHVDRHFAQRQTQGGRIVHGLLSASCSLGSLSLDAPHIVGRANPRAFIESYSINHRQPVKLNDTVCTQWSVDTIQATTQREATRITTGFRVNNHRAESVADGELLLCLVGDDDPDSGVFAPSVPAWDPFVFEPKAGVYFLEDYDEGGQQGMTEGRTLSEADIVNYAGFSADYNPLQVDREFARGSLFKQRIVHPMLVFNIAFANWLRQWSRLSMPDDGFPGHVADSWQFIAPLYIGDTMHCRYKTLAVRHSRSRPSLGVLTFGLQMLNQREEVVQQGRVLMLYPARQ
jgi:acyl dehydratase